MDIKDRIKKLLALSASPNENEAQAAMLKAKELMAKYKMEDADLVNKSELVHIECPAVKWTSDSGRIWINNLCKVLCDNYCCVSSWSRYKGHRTYELQITGFKEDAELCKAVIEYAIGFINGQVKILQRKYRSRNPKSIEQSYAEGFLVGLEIAFELQKDEHPEWGLVVVKPEEVKNYEDNLGSKEVKTRKAAFNPLAYMMGQKDGEEFNARKVLEG